MFFKQSNKFRNYNWEQMEGVILYSNNIETDLSEIKKQIKYLIFEAGYGCGISMKLIKLVEEKNIIEAIKIYRYKNGDYRLK